MNDNTTIERRFYLYTYPDGRQYVFQLVGTGHLATCAVTDRSPADPEARFVDMEAPDDLEDAGVLICEEAANWITGYYLDGPTLLTELAVQLLRIEPGSAYEPFCRALFAMVKGLPPDQWGAAADAGPYAA